MTDLATHQQQVKPEIATQEIQWPPTNIYSDEPPLESDFHRDQINRLIRLLEYWWQDRTNFYISGNITVYYKIEQLDCHDFRGPDVFVVLDAEKRKRRSWTVWGEQGKYPNVVIELLSDATEIIDKGKKKQLYQDVWRVFDYFLFHPETMEFWGFHWVEGQYEALLPNEEGWLWSEQLGLFLGVKERELRLFTEKGQLIPLPEEYERQASEQIRQERQAIEQERKAEELALQAMEQERQAKERALQQVAELKALLKTQGIDPKNLPES